MEGVRELHRRTDGIRESGAFLLGKKGRVRRINQFVYYDDVDPCALSTGIVVLNGRKLGSLWEHCRKTGQTVVADVHVHPHGYGQSRSDRHNPVIAEKGHIALILPDFARDEQLRNGIGIYVYQGDRNWSDESRCRPLGLHIGWWPKWL